MDISSEYLSNEINKCYTVIENSYKQSSNKSYVGETTLLKSGSELCKNLFVDKTNKIP